MELALSIFNYNCMIGAIMLIFALWRLSTCVEPFPMLAGKSMRYRWAAAIPAAIVFICLWLPLIIVAKFKQ